MQQVFNVHCVVANAICIQASHDSGIGFTQGLRAHLLVTFLVSSFQLGATEGFNLFDQRGILLRRFPVPNGLTGFTHQVMNRVDRDQALLMTEHHAAQHHLFAELLRF